MPGTPFCGRAKVVNCRVEIAHEAGGHRYEILAFCGRYNPTRCALQQFYANKYFELFDRQGYRRLAAGQYIGGAVKAAFFCDNNKRAQMSECDIEVFDIVSSRFIVLVTH